ncbi:MAG: cysteine desulfurase NifS [Dehalococcoidales bacterium]|nr:cysteine desulfurase NifS [Dehalococcoidales bacterium]
MKRIYLDYAATTPMRSEVLEEMQPYLTEAFGNPSSIYSYGHEAKTGMDKARTAVARLLAAREEEIVFTGGGTEADNFAIKGVGFANRSKGNHIITSSIEHHAVLETCQFMETQGFTVTYLPVNEYGMLNPDDVKKAITPETILITIMHANNEIGTIQPISEIGKIAHEAGVYFHTDAVQTVGHIPADVNELNVDMLSTSAHKLYGPKGVGALYIRKGTRIVPLIHGGEQEHNRRASTENVAGIVGFGKAAELAKLELEEESARITSMRDRLIDNLVTKIDEIQLNGHPTQRLPNNINLTIAYTEGESIVLNLDLKGICASTGSACTSSSLEPSHVLVAIGLPQEIAYSSFRMTLGKWNTEEDIDRVIQVLPEVIASLRAMSPLYKKR